MLKRTIIALVFIITTSLFFDRQATAQKSDSPAVRKAIEKSLPLLDSIRNPFLEKTGCVSCHHNSLPAMTARMALDRGFNVNERTANEESERILDILNVGREKILQGDGFGGGQNVASYTLVGLAANKTPPNKTTDAIVYYVMGRQSADGRWTKAANRQPLGGSDITTTALSIRALQLYVPKGLRQEAATRIQRASAWLAKATSWNNEDQTFQLRGLVWAKTDQQMLKKMAQHLLAQQRQDGGWGQEPTLESDAYATGQALTALHEAGRLSVADPPYQRGVRYLLADQAVDGSWAVMTRSFPIQKYFESGFPYGDNQWISAAATSWATMALLLTIEPPKNLTEH